MNQGSSKATRLLALLTLAVFACGLLLVLLTGAALYRRLVDRGEESYRRRTALQYLTTRVRQAEAVKIEDFQGCPALVLEETSEGEAILTRVYCHGGWLRELYALPEAELSPEDGAPLLEAGTLELSRDRSLLSLTLDGSRIFLWLPQGTEAGP